MCRSLGNQIGEIEVLMDMVEYELVRGKRQEATIRLKVVEHLIGHDHEKTQYRHYQSRLAEYRRRLNEHSTR